MFEQNVKSIRARATELGLIYSEEPIKPGDTYLAERNTGPHLLTCKFVDPRHWIEAVEDAYPYNTWDCIKIVD